MWWRLCTGSMQAVTCTRAAAAAAATKLLALDDALQLACGAAGAPTHCSRPRLGCPGPARGTHRACKLGFRAEGLRRSRGVLDRSWNTAR